MLNPSLVACGAVLWGFASSLIASVVLRGGWALGASMGGWRPKGGAAAKLIDLPRREDGVAGSI